MLNIKYNYKSTPEFSVYLEPGSYIGCIEFTLNRNIGMYRYINSKYFGFRLNILKDRDSIMY
jgi:hypothetical protein